jgi:hypothetical protein
VLSTRSALGMGAVLARVRAEEEARNFPSACFCVNTVRMKRQTVITKKRRGPPPTGKGTLVGVRLQPDRLAAVDAWITKQNARMTRPEAIRAMLDAALIFAAKDPGEKPVSRPARASRARELAAETIDKMIDPSAPPEEHAHRRRRLTKGPEEFREVRIDRPKAKDFTKP